MRILQVAHAFPPTIGGVETHLWDITQALSARGHVVSCLVGGARGEQHVEAAGEPIVVTRRPVVQADALIARRAGLAEHAVAHDLLGELNATVAPVIAALRPDVIHMHNGHHFAPELAATVLACAGGAPVLNAVHDRIGEHLYPEVLQWGWASVLYASAYLRDHLPSSRPMEVRHLSVDLSIFRPDGVLDARLAGLEHPVIFHPARLLRWKGIEVGLEAFIRLRARYGAGSLILCDSTLTVDDQAEIAGFRAALEKRAMEAGVALHVHFLQFARDQMPAAYRTADLIWYPTSDEEPLGLVPLEAMACGARLVVSRSGGMVETVRDEQTGLVVPRGNAAALAIAAARLLDDPELSGRLVATAKSEVERFSADAYTDDLERIYRRALKGGNDE